MAALGMTPRGELGLTFADAGARLVPRQSAPISPGICAALVAAVFVTTLVAPSSAIEKRNQPRRVRVEYAGRMSGQEARE
jgi:hypothetical protein